MQVNWFIESRVKSGSCRKSIATHWSILGRPAPYQWTKNVDASEAVSDAPDAEFETSDY